MWQPGTLIIASGELRRRYSHFKTRTAQRHRDLGDNYIIYAELVRKNIAMIISAKEIGYGTKGPKLLVQLLVNNNMLTLQRANELDSLFEVIV